MKRSNLCFTSQLAIDTRSSALKALTSMDDMLVELALSTEPSDTKCTASNKRAQAEGCQAEGREGGEVREGGEGREGRAGVTEGGREGQGEVGEGGCC